MTEYDETIRQFKLRHMILLDTCRVS